MHDYIIVGGGIVGVSTAWQLKQRHADARILLIDKEPLLAAHQTGHNSGVIHAGIYYAPGSLKARFCKAGVKATIDFCRDNDIAFEQCGKLLVATDELEHERMRALYERALVNELDVELIDAERLRELEPNVTGIGAILVKTTGIVDYPRICRRMGELFEELRGEVRLNVRVAGLEETEESVAVITARGDRIAAKYLIACGGLQADRITRMLGIEAGFRIVPYRGEYYRLPETMNDIVSHLIYPIPDPDLPFLGVHLTRMIDGSVTVGPNAVQGWKREGYGRINVNAKDIWSMLSFPGFWKVTASNLKTGLLETWNSLWKPGYLKQVRKYCPSVELSDLGPHPAGIRAQAVLEDGTLVHDFLFAESPRSLHVCNAPSPAATSAIPIGAHICDKVHAARF